MTFSQVYGNEQVSRALAGMVDSGKVAHAILLHEDNGGGGFAMAMAFLQYLFCLDHRGTDSCGVCPTCNKIGKYIHPDIHFVFPVNAGTSLDFLPKFRELAVSNPYFTEEELSEALEIEGKSAIIAVGESKEIINRLSLSSLEGGYRAVVIYLPEKMNQEAANRLLKLIEEPPVLTQFVMITHAPEKVLTTIRSRCQNIRVIPDAGIHAGGELREEQVLLCELMENILSRRLLAALETGEKIAALPSRESARMFCKCAADAFRTLFLIQQGLDSMAEDSPMLPKVRDWSARIRRKTFPRAAVGIIDNIRKLIDRNVNLKILFTDMVDRLYLQI